MSYQDCLDEATVRKEKGNLKLCPEGYCTAKMKFKVYPSAYANGYASQVCKGAVPDLEGNYIDDVGYKSRITDEETSGKENSLQRWFKEQWVNVCEKDSKGNYLPCGRKKGKLNKKNYPYCRPLKKLKGTTVKSVNELTDKDIDRMCKKKRSLEQGVEGKPTRVYIKDKE